MGSLLSDKSKILFAKYQFSQALKNSTITVSSERESRIVQNQNYGRQPRPHLMTPQGLWTVPRVSAESPRLGPGWFQCSSRWWSLQVRSPPDPQSFAALLSERGCSSEQVHPQILRWKSFKQIHTYIWTVQKSTPSVTVINDQYVNNRGDKSFTKKKKNKEKILYNCCSKSGLNRRNGGQALKERWDGSNSHAAPSGQGLFPLGRDWGFTMS